MKDLERILLGWDHLEGETVAAPELTHDQLDILKEQFGKATLLKALRKYQDSSIHMSFDKTMNEYERRQYGRDVEKLQKSIDYVKGTK